MRPLLLLVTIAGLLGGSAAPLHAHGRAPAREPGIGSRRVTEADFVADVRCAMSQGPAAVRGEAAVQSPAAARRVAFAQAPVAARGIAPAPAQAPAGGGGRVPPAEPAAVRGRAATPPAPAAGRGRAAAQEPPVPAVFEPAVAAARQLPRLHSLLVSRKGELLLERYFNGRRASALANIKSASKSVISALVGIAIAKGAIPSVRQPISTYFGDVLSSPDSPKRAITVEDLLTMRSGLETTSNRNYGAWVRSGNWVRHALTRPLLYRPGTWMTYSTGNTHLLSAILTKATGQSTWQFAQTALAKPLGFTLAPWPRDPQGIFFGGNDMLMTPRQMLAFGELYLARGRAGATQVVPEPWVADSFVARGRSPISEREYGYGWWMRPMAGLDAFYAWGFGGQYIVVVPALDLVVVSTSAATVAEDRRTHRQTVDDLIEQLVVAPLAAAR